MKFAIADTKLRKLTVVAVGFFAVALGKEGKKVVKERILKKFEQARIVFNTIIIEN